MQSISSDALQNILLKCLPLLLRSIAISYAQLGGIADVCTMDKCTVVIWFGVNEYFEKCNSYATVDRLACAVCPISRFIPCLCAVSCTGFR